MQSTQSRRTLTPLVLAWLGGALGCAPSGGGGGGAGSGGGMTGGDGNVFIDNGLDAPAALPEGQDNAPPAGAVVFPPEGAEVGTGELLFIWEASDQNETNVDTTVYVGGDENVFENPLIIQGVRTSPEELEHRVTLQLVDGGVYYWGVEISDGVQSIRRPAADAGTAFEVAEGVFNRLGLDDVVLICPRESAPARSVTTFQWSIGEVQPLRTQVFVSRADQANPFEQSLRVFDVQPPTAESWQIAEADALPLGLALSWGLRMETADQVLFSFDGQVGVQFVADENVPPTGLLIGPGNDSSVAQGSVPQFAWEVDAGNCEDPLTLTFAFEQIGDNDAPAALFDSGEQLEVIASTAEADLSNLFGDLQLAAGRWAWGIRADDGTDQTALPDSDDASQNFRTFILDGPPRIISGPTLELRNCGQTAARALVFELEDLNGLDTVAVQVTFSLMPGDVFDAPLASLSVPVGSGSETQAEVEVFLEDVGCQQLAEGLGFYGLTLDDTVNAPVQVSIENDVAVTGACCAPDGTCIDAEASNCAANNYQGDGTSCALVQCAALTGACCVPDGSCVETTIINCTAGQYQGDGISCLQANCPQPDCDSNGVADSQDIALGTSDDCNTNGVPDECEGQGALVDAGTLKVGTISLQRFYDSGPDGNDLVGRICPASGTDSVRWSVTSAPPGVVVALETPGAIGTPFVVTGAVAGDYVFTLNWVDRKLTDTVTLTLVGP